MTKDQKRVEFIQRLALFIIRCKMKGIDVMPISFYRTTQEQKAKYKMKVSQLDGVNKRSKHQEWQAMDCPVVDWRNDGTAELIWNSADPRYDIMYDIAVKCGLVTGHKWMSMRDSSHVELSEGLFFG